MRRADQAPRVTRAGEPVTQAFGLGGFAAQALIHENQLVKIPIAMPFPQAALLGCGVVTGAGAVLNTARVRPGDTVAIIGAGGVGLNAVTAASLAGAAQIIAIDIHDATLQKARRFGATDVINSATVNPVEAVRELLPNGVDSVFDFVGLNEVTTQALEMLTVGGALYLIGVSSPDSQVTVNLVGRRAAAAPRRRGQHRLDQLQARYPAVFPDVSRRTVRAGCAGVGRDQPGPD